MNARRTLILGTILAATGASASIESRFDTGTDGWLSVNVSFPDLAVLGVHTPTWTGSSITDFEFMGGGLFVLAAPAAYRGDLSAYYGGSVTYRLSDEVSDGQPYPNLLLRGGGTVLFFTTPPPGTGLTDFAFTLSPAGWLTGAGVQPSESEFKQVLSNLDVFAINADWKTLGEDVVELDDVVVREAVPEPATLACLGIGLALLKKRRK